MHSETLLLKFYHGAAESARIWMQGEKARRRLSLLVSSYGSPLSEKKALSSFYCYIIFLMTPSFWKNADFTEP